MKLSLKIGMTILFFIFGGWESNICDESSLQLIVEHRVIILKKEKQKVRLEIKLINNSKNDLITYNFENSWNDVLFSENRPLEWWAFGFNLIVYNKKGEFIPRSHIDFGPNPQIIEGLINASTRDSTIKLIREKYGDEAYWEEQKKLAKQEFFDSKKIIAPGDTLSTELDVNFEDYYLKKGEYEFHLCYVLNKQLLHFIDELPPDLFLGIVRSNKVKLIVE